MDSESKIKIEKRIMNLSLAGSILFMIVEGIMAYVTHSHSILMDCVFDVTDLIMVGPFLVLVPLLYKPVTEQRPYGFSQVESLFIIVKYSILLAVTAELVISSIQLILDGGHAIDAGAIAIFEFLVGVGCSIFYMVLYYFSKKYASMTIRAELYIWKLDIIGSAGVAIAFVVQILVQNSGVAWIAPYMDPLVAVIMALVLCVEPLRMIATALKELVLFAPEQEIMDQIREIAEEKMEGGTYEIHFLDVIQTGRKTWVEIYVSNHKEAASIPEMTLLRNEIRKELKKQFDQIYVELILDLPEPAVG